MVPYDTRILFGSLPWEGEKRYFSMKSKVSQVAVGGPKWWLRGVCVFIIIQGVVFPKIQARQNAQSPGAVPALLSPWSPASLSLLPYFT